MRYLLCTDIISEVIKAQPSQDLLAWMAAQIDENLFIASLTIAEIRRGILEMPMSMEREALDAWFIGPEGPQALFAERILPFDEHAALIWAQLMAEGRMSASRRAGIDMIIAAIAAANNCIVVTSNEGGFLGIEIVNPTLGTA